MVRNYNRKRDAVLPNEHSLKLAVYAVLVLSMPIRIAAREYGLFKSTVGDYVKKTKRNGGVIPEFVKDRQFHRQVISSELESLLVDYLRLVWPTCCLLCLLCLRLAV